MRRNSQLFLPGLHSPSPLTRLTSRETRSSAIELLSVLPRNIATGVCLEGRRSPDLTPLIVWRRSRPMTPTSASIRGTRTYCSCSTPGEGGEGAAPDPELDDVSGAGPEVSGAVADSTGSPASGGTSSEP